ncbi:MAG TPA: hypothetical protein DHV24_07460, partial [Candidatus Margulisbacteria bacterium]|nr:hypothetical protein [Candidatus Margulisiibacteriota bacterium]
LLTGVFSLRYGFARLLIFLGSNLSAVSDPFLLGIEIILLFPGWIFAGFLSNIFFYYKKMLL